MDKITSASNEKVKYLVQLRDKSSVRRTDQKFLIEGFRETIRAMASGIKIIQAYWCPKFDRDKQIYQLNIPETVITEISETVFAKLALRETSDGIIVLAEIPEFNLDDIILPETPLILVVEAVEKPGNLGAIMRTVDAAGLDLVIFCDCLADIYNPNTIRSSLGCIFSSQIATTTSKDAFNFLMKKGVKILAAALSETAVSYTDADYRQASAIVVGTEATGLSDIWLTNEIQKVIIPMRGIADSLNVSVSAAVILFEAVRQRKNKPAI